MLRWLRLGTAPPDPSPDEVAFSRALIAALESTQRWDDAWVEQLETSADYDSLANIAAVRRWRVGRAAHDLETLQAPESLRDLAARTLALMLMTADAFQRLSGGYRFSKFERVCEGHALLDDARARRYRLLKELRAYASRGSSNRRN